MIRPLFLPGHLTSTTLQHGSRTWRLESAMRSGCARRSQQGPLMRRLMSSASRLVCPPPMTFTKLSPAFSKGQKSGREALCGCEALWTHTRFTLMLFQPHDRDDSQQ